MRNDNIVYEKSKKFAVRMVRLKQWICNEKREYALADQILRSGTSIGANISESIDAVSKRDFINKLGISLKECSETIYWLDILHDYDIIDLNIYNSLCQDCRGIYALLTAIIKKSKQSKDDSCGSN